MSDVRNLTFLDRVKIQAEVLVPLIKGFDAEIGPERARAIAKEALRVEVVARSPDAFDFDVTRCAYAEFYEALGEPELELLFVCDLYNAMAEGLGPDLAFERSQTIMQRATHCDFRYRRRR